MKLDKRPFLLNTTESLCFELNSLQQIIEEVDGVEDVEVALKEYGNKITCYFNIFEKMQ